MSICALQDLPKNVSRIVKIVHSATAQNRYPSNLNQLDIAAVLSPHSNDEVLFGEKSRKIVKSLIVRHSRHT